MVLHLCINLQTSYLTIYRKIMELFGGNTGCKMSLVCRLTSMGADHGGVEENKTHL